MSQPIKLKPICRSRQVLAVLVSPDGDVFIGSNGVEHPQKVCPRKESAMKRGKGWHLCRETCGQQHHAEQDVLAKAGAAAQGARIYILGHDCACPACKAAMKKAGVASYIAIPGENSSPGEAWPREKEPPG